MNKTILQILIFLIGFNLFSQIQENKGYYKNGKLKSIGKYDNGKRISKWKLFYKNGKLKEIKNGTLKKTRTH